MAKPVEDTQENMKICKDFCGICPTFKENKLKESPPHALFCARGKSEIATDKIVDKGCTCFGKSSASEPIGPSSVIGKKVNRSKS